MKQESWSRSERRKRSKKCSNPKGFTMKQFCRNVRTRSKSGQKMNEIIEAVLTRLLNEELLVKASVMPSEISGLGLFADEEIPAGTIVFSWNDDVDQEYPKNYPDRLPRGIKKDFTDLASFDANGWFLAGDGAAYFNHSKSNNISSVPSGQPPAKRERIANRDIAVGEEMTMDYEEIGTDVP